MHKIIRFLIRLAYNWVTKNRRLTPKDRDKIRIFVATVYGLNELEGPIQTYKLMKELIKDARTHQNRTKV